MDTWIVAWLLIALIGTVAVLAVLVALVRHVVVVGRTVREFQEAIRPIADRITEQGARAGERTSRLGGSRSVGRS